MGKKDRLDYIDRRSDELARSGNFHGWQEIEITLRGEGYHEARGALDSRFKRQWLDDLCAEAHRSKSSE